MSSLTESWAVEFHSGIPVYKQIIHFVQAAIAEGRLRENDQLPTIRALHKKLNVNPNTVAKAYRELEATGIISAQQGSGCFVTQSPKPAAVLSTRARKDKIGELSARLISEARGLQIPLHLILKRLQHELPSH